MSSTCWRGEWFTFVWYAQRLVTDNYSAVAEPSALDCSKSYSSVHLSRQVRRTISHGSELCKAI